MGSVCCLWRHLLLALQIGSSSKTLCTDIAIMLGYFCPINSEMIVLESHEIGLHLHMSHPKIRALQAELQLNTFFRLPKHPYYERDGKGG